MKRDSMNSDVLEALEGSGAGLAIFFADPVKCLEGFLDAVSGTQHGRPFEPLTQDGLSNYITPAPGE